MRGRGGSLERFGVKRRRWGASWWGGAFKEGRGWVRAGCGRGSSSHFSFLCAVLLLVLFVFPLFRRPVWVFSRLFPH